MILLKRGAGDPARIDNTVAILRPSTLEEVDDALLAFADSGGDAAYIERIGARYRWSPAVQGGPYPLQRVLARFLGCKHTELTIGYRMLDERWCIVDDPGHADRGPYVVLDTPVDVEAVRAGLA